MKIGLRIATINISSKLCSLKSTKQKNRLINISNLKEKACGVKDEIPVLFSTKVLAD